MFELCPESLSAPGHSGNNPFLFGCAAPAAQPSHFFFTPLYIVPQSGTNVNSALWESDPELLLLPHFLAEAKRRFLVKPHNF